MRTGNGPVDLMMWRSTETLRRKILVQRWAKSLTEWVGKERENLKREFIMMSYEGRVGSLEGDVDSR